MAIINASNTSGLVQTGDASGVLALQTGGTTAVTIDASGNVGIGTSSPTQKLDVTGNINTSGSLNSINTFGFKNRIINGGMAIDQRNAGAQITAANLAPSAYMVDRWSYSASQAAKFTAQQNAGAVTTPVGFPNYLGMTVASAFTVGAGDWFCIGQSVEGFNFADLAWGTASAKTVTLSFVVYSSLTGTFGGALRNNATNRSYPFTYSIPTANTWTTISVTIAGDTSGTWVGATNGLGVSLFFGLGVGTTYSGTAGAWAATNYISVTGAVSVVGTSGATFYITGVQLEKGSTATSFDYRPYGTELALCQRYFEKSFNVSVAPANGTTATTLIDNAGCFASMAINGQVDGGFISFKVSKRAVPTLTIYGNNSGYWNYYSGGASLWGSNAYTQGTLGENGSAFSQQVVNATAIAIRGHWTAASEL